MTDNNEKTFIKGISFVGFLGGYPTSVDVNNGKIVRFRPFHYDSRSSPDQYRPWTFEARGKVFTPPNRTLPSHLALSYKKRVYSTNRIPYPLKRVDWNPFG